MNDIVFVTGEQLPSNTPSITRVLQTFMAGRSPNTMRGYRMDLRDFAKFTGHDNIEDATRALFSLGPGGANDLALQFQQKMKDLGLSPATANRKLAAIRSLVRLGRMLGVINWNIDVQSQKSGNVRDMRGPDTESFVKMLKCAQEEADPVVSARNTAILWLLFGTALRREEIVTLDIEHVVKDKIFVLGKGRASRELVTMPTPIRQAVETWIKCRADAKKTDPLFISFSRNSFGKRLQGLAIWRIVVGYGNAAGVGHVRPHGLRHAAITHALNITGGDLRKVQRFSRHRKIDMLQRYDDDRRDYGGEIAEQVAQDMKKSTEKQ